MRKLIILLGVILVACSSVKVKGVKQAENFRVSKYNTFDFFQVEASGDAIGSDYASNLDLLKKAITKQFLNKGISHASDNPDLKVNIGILVSEEIQTRETSFANPGDRMYYMGQRTYSWQAEEVVVGTYNQGSVTVDLVDRETGKLVWQGTAESILPGNEKKVPSLIEEGMKLLFAKLK